MSRNSNNTDNELIITRRKKIRIKNGMILFIFLLAVLCILAVKLPYFAIKNVEVFGNKSIKNSEVKTSSKIYKGNNIFYINLYEAKKNILENPYIGNVSIKRKLPSTIVINVVERNAVYYVEYDSKFYIIDSNGVLLEKKASIKNMNLVEIKGVNVSGCEIGNEIKDKNTRKIDTLKTIGSLISQSNVYFGIKSVDVSSLIDIKAYVNNMAIKLGSTDDMRGKLNKSLNIIKQQNLADKKGYVDVRFKGNPVFSTVGK